MAESHHQYLIEFRQVGNVIRVSAVDPVTLQEAVIIIPAGKKVTKTEMQHLAIRKLEYVLGKHLADHERKLKAESPDAKGKSNSGITSDIASEKGRKHYRNDVLC